MSVIEIDKIIINAHRRAADSQKVEELAESIRVNGLINPITVDRNFNLIAGLHRLTAYQSLGYEQIECKIVDYEDSDRARLAEIDENLIRNELNAIERGELWLERDRILDKLGMRAKSGDNQYRKKRKGGEMVSPPPRTTSELAKETGYSERTYQHGKQIARDIAPEVKEQIKNTPIAESPTTLLKIVKAGSKERQQAEQAEKAAQEAKAKQNLAEVEQQKQLAAQAREQQKRKQLAMFESAIAEKQAKQIAKKPQNETKFLKDKQSSTEPIKTRIGDEWLLKRQMIYCGDTTSKDFREKLPSHPVLAIASPCIAWNHDYLIDEAQVVAVMRTEGHIYDFCHRSRMPFRYEFVSDGIYVAICSKILLLKPDHPVNVEGVEGIVTYLISLYTKPGNFVVAPSLGHGEVLIACERLGRICFIGDENPERVNRAIYRWQQFTGKQAQKV